MVFFYIKRNNSLSVIVAVTIPVLLLSIRMIYTLFVDTYIYKSYDLYAYIYDIQTSQIIMIYMILLLLCTNKGKSISKIIIIDIFYFFCRLISYSTYKSINYYFDNYPIDFTLKSIIMSKYGLFLIIYIFLYTTMFIIAFKVFGKDTPENQMTNDTLNSTKKLALPFTDTDFWCAFLSILFPIVGLLFFMLWKNTNVSRAKLTGIGAIIGFVMSIVVSVSMILILFTGGTKIMPFY